MSCFKARTLARENNNLINNQIEAYEKIYSFINVNVPDVRNIYGAG